MTPDPSSALTATKLTHYPNAAPRAQREALCYAPHMMLPTTADESRARLIFALDVPTSQEAHALVRSLEGSLRFYKVGLELWTSGGPALVEELVRAGNEVFLDLKFHDIPATVANAVKNIAGLGATLTTLHGPPSSVRAAVEARPGGKPALLGVTVLTSMTMEECQFEFGLMPEASVQDLVLGRARMLVGAGCDGVVASPQEAKALRRILPDALIVTPGIRPAGSDKGDQARVATPRQACADGADYLVVGRPIRDAPDRRATVEAIVAEMVQGFAERVASAR